MPSLPLLRDPLSPAHPPAERVVLTGFMGSGKSTIGRMLARDLGWTFTDLDALIVEQTGKTVAELFAERGERGFRELESGALATALNTARAVIALGGGTVDSEANRQLLRNAPATLVVFLSAPFATLAARCAGQAADPKQPARPLLADMRQAEARYAARQPLYHQVAHHVAETADEPAHITSRSVFLLVRPPA